MSEYKGFEDWDSHDYTIETNNIKKEMTYFLIKLGLHSTTASYKMDNILKMLMTNNNFPNKLFVNPHTSDNFKKNK